LLNEVMSILQDDKIIDEIPAKTGRKVYFKISEFVGITDIFKDFKQDSNSIAANLYPDLKQLVRNNENPLKTAAKIAILGNYIDLGTNVEYDLENELGNLTLKVDDFNVLNDELENAKKVLYIADNAGEIFFDKVFIEEILANFNVEIYFSIRGGPIINDATLEDAIIAGLDKICKIVEGTQSPGIILDEASPEFLNIYKKADVIISKGQGNFESLSDRPKIENIFFLLKAKCNLMEKYFKVPIGSSILASIQYLKNS